MPREKKPETDTVRLSKELLRRIRRIAGHLDLSAPDYLAERLAPILDADESRMMDELSRERKGKPAKGS